MNRVLPRVRPGTRVRGSGIPGSRGPTGVGKRSSVRKEVLRRMLGKVWQLAVRSLERSIQGL